MTRRLVLFSSVITVVCALAISVSVVFADSHDGDASENKFAAKVAAILGLDETRVNDAINQARKELTTEFLKSKLDTLVANGKMTQDEADEKLNSFESNSMDLRSSGKHFFGSMHHGKSSWKEHDKQSWKKKWKDVAAE